MRHAQSGMPSEIAMLWRNRIILQGGDIRSRPMTVNISDRLQSGCTQLVCPEKLFYFAD